MEQVAGARPFPIVMYHYVRPIARGLYPGIKGLEAEDFRSQVRYLKRHHTIVPMEALVDAMAGGEALPESPCVLTFDDGYSDHYRYAFPIMASEGVTGAFYPPRSVVEERKVLEVNKVHFTLALSDDIDALEAKVDEGIEQERQNGAELPTTDALKKELRHDGRFDPAGIIYIKRVLQHALPDDVRARIADKLFREVVTEDEEAFAEELYLSVDQAKVMLDGGMHFGGHGDRHLWHSKIGEDGQRAEIEGANRILDLIGVPEGGRTYCYPYGDHDETTLRLLGEYGYAAGFLAKPGLTDPANEHRFQLSRLDTNDLPKSVDSAPNGWTRLALGERADG